MLFINFFIAFFLMCVAKLFTFVLKGTYCLDLTAVELLYAQLLLLMSACSPVPSPALSCHGGVCLVK